MQEERLATDVDHTATRPFILRARPPARFHISAAVVRQRPGHSAFADELGWTVTGRSPLWFLLQYVDAQMQPEPYMAAMLQDGAAPVTGSTGIQ